MKEKKEKKIFKVITYMSFILIIVFTIFMLLPSKELHAQAEFVDDNTFVISNVDYEINEDDVRDLFLFFANYVETYDLLIEDEMEVDYADIGNNLYDGLHIDFQADLSSLEYDLYFVIDDLFVHMEMINSDFEIVFFVVWNKDDDTISINGIASEFDFNVVITLPESETEPIKIYSSLQGVINFFVQPFLDLITDIGVGDNIISIGFGSIEWFNFTLLQLANLILSFLVIWIFLKLIFKLLKLVVRVITGGAINV